MGHSDECRSLLKVNEEIAVMVVTANYNKRYLYEAVYKQNSDHWLHGFSNSSYLIAISRIKEVATGTY